MLVHAGRYDQPPSPSTSFPANNRIPYIWTLLYAGYCLQPAAVNSPTHDLDASVTVNLCDVCLHDLTMNRLPKFCLVRVDPGGIPRSLDPALQLLPPTLIEEQLLATYRSIRMVIVIHPSPDGCSLQQYRYRGHVIAFPNAPLSDVLYCLPLAKVHERVQVVFVTQCTDRQDMEKALRQATALEVRGANVVNWALHLSKVSEFFSAF